MPLCKLHVCYSISMKTSISCQNDRMLDRCPAHDLQSAQANQWQLFPPKQDFFKDETSFEENVPTKRKVSSLLNLCSPQRLIRNYPFLRQQLRYHPSCFIIIVNTEYEMRRWFVFATLGNISCFVFLEMFIMMLFFPCI